MITILSFVLVLGVLIFVHELGHFVMARRVGVRVLTFSLGFGPKLLAVRRGDTEYCISAIPLGGYVKMAGETAEHTRTGAADEFLSKTKWQRFQVLVMGPVMNLALAIVLLAIVLYQGVYAPAYEVQPIVVGTVTEGSPAEAAGIRPGDRVLTAEGTATPTWEALGNIVARHARQNMDLVVERDGRTDHRRLVKPADAPRGTRIGIGPVTRPQIVSVDPGNAADRAGLQPFDVIVAIAGESAPSRDRVRALTVAHNNRPMTMEVERAGERVAVTVTPHEIEGEPRIGVEMRSFEVREFEPGVIGALSLSLDRNWDRTRAILRTLGGVLTGRASVRRLAGPVGIAEQTSIAVQQGWIAVLTLMSLISLNLGLLNLMPIPVLDGGHITILALEGVSRRDFSVAVKEKMQLAGFALLVLLMVTVIYNDIARIAG